MRVSMMTTVASTATIRLLLLRHGKIHQSGMMVFMPFQVLGKGLGVGILGCNSLKQLVDFLVTVKGSTDKDVAGDAVHDSL